MWQTFAEKLLCYSLLKKAPVLSLKGRYLFWKALDLLKKRPCLLRWNSGSFGHDFTYVRIHSPVRMCGSLRDVRKKACFLVRDKTQCAQIYCKNDVADYKKEIHGYKKGSNIEYNPKFLSKIKKALEFQCLYRSFYFHWLKQSWWSLFTLDWVGGVFSSFILGIGEMLFFLILTDISLITIKNEWNKNAYNNTAIDKNI